MDIKRMLCGKVARLIVILLICASLLGLGICLIKSLYIYSTTDFQSGEYIPWVMLNEETQTLDYALRIFRNDIPDGFFEENVGYTEYNGITVISGTSKEIIDILSGFSPEISNLRFQLYCQDILVAKNTDEIPENAGSIWYGGYDELSDETGKIWYAGEDVSTEIIYYSALNTSVNDKYQQNYEVYLSLTEQGNNYFVGNFIWLAVVLLLSVIYILQSLYVPSGGKIRLSIVERIPAEIMLCVDAVLVALDLYVAYVVMKNLFSRDYISLINSLAAGLVKITSSFDYFIFVQIVIVVICAVILYLLILRALRAAVRRIAAGKWYRNTLIYRLLVLIMNIKHFWKWVLFCAVDFFLLVLFIPSRSSSMLTAFMLYNIAAFLYVSYFLVRLGKLQSAAERLAGGEDGVRFETTGPLDPVGKSAKIFNRIGDSVSRAVEERMKSERLRTELITNVSHDIKTPLTSIISYVDLIKKERPENENIRGYIEVLDRQSGRLKKLIEDLIEASKASSGVLPVNAAELDVSELLRQALGEYSERFAAAGVNTVVNIPDERVVVFADGRHMWRIFDNLSSNICKYSLAGTRAYFDLKVERGEAVILFRNISSEQSGLSGIDLTERFVRRDSSRHTEGSGLGLAIAKSLAELQGASLDVSVDGDLFKVTVRIKCLRVEKPCNMGQSRNMEGLSDLERLSDLENLSDLTDDNDNSSDSPDADGISGSNESDNANPNTQN